VNSTVAFEIGGAFFLAVLFMAGTMTGGVFPKIGRSIKITLCCFSVLVLGYITLSNWSEAIAGMASIFSDSPAPSLKPATESVSKKTAPARAAAPKPWPKSAGKVSEVEYVIKVEPKPAPEEAKAPEPQEAAPPDANPDVKPEGRGKKVLKSIGHAFGFGKKKKDSDGSSK
jgi:hypothetical protein